MAKKIGPRGAPRKTIHFSVLCRSGIQNFAGELVNISESGALPNSRRIRPTTGSIVTIEFLKMTKELVALVGDL